MGVPGVSRRALSQPFIFSAQRFPPVADLALSESQKRAISHDRGHLRIVACPGSGKTETVSRRVAELVRKGAAPSGIVAFTFTRKAADGLKLRIRGMLEGRADLGDMYVGTIDAFCLYMLKKIRPEYRSFEVLDGAKRAAFLNRWYRILRLDALDGGQGRWGVIDEFARSVDLAVTEQVDVALAGAEFADCFRRYSETLREERFFDFVSVTDTLLGSLRDPGAMERLGSDVEHVVFDEYQDVNRLQERLLEALSAGARSVCAVGDDDQNIFQWRGSSVSHILEFPSKYGASTETLGTNYRATDALVSAASRLISGNRGRVAKAMEADPGRPNSFERGDMVHQHFGTDTEEFGFVCDTIEDLRGAEFAGRGGARALSYRDMAVIVRTNEDAARVVKFLSGRGIECVAESGTSVFERPVVSLATDCIMYAFDEYGYGTDDKPDLGGLARRYAEAVPGGDAWAFAQGMRQVREIGDAARAKEGGWLPDLGLQEFYQRVLSAMGAERGALSDSDMYGLAVLSRAISDYEYVYRFLRAGQVAGLRWFISRVAAREYSDPAHADPGRADAVHVLTIWKAKGLEFPAVFVPSFDNRRLPPPQPVFIGDHLYESGRYAGSDEDERRAYYVAVTRSQKYLFLTSAARREIGVGREPPKNARRPHRFASEIVGPEFSPAAPVGRPRAAPAAGAARGALLQSSYGKLSSYGRCPHEYRLRHVMGFNPGVPNVFNYGTCIHNILNYLHAEFLRGGRVPAEPDIRRAFDGMFHLRFASKAQNEAMKKSGIGMVTRYVLRCGGDFERMQDAEKRFEFRLGGALVSGSIDQVLRADGGPRIVDFKVGGSDYARDERAEQVRLYACAARASLGYRPGSAAIHALGDQDIEEVGVGDAELEETEARVRRRIELIAAKKFEPSPEKEKCGACDFRALCQHKGFEVGPRFGPARDKVRSPRGEDAGDEELPAGEGAPVVSRAMAEKAEKLASLASRNADGSFSVPSLTDPSKKYTVSEGMKCGCRGFAEYPQRHPGTAPMCSHAEAAKIFRARRAGQ